MNPPDPSPPPLEENPEYANAKPEAPPAKPSKIKLPKGSILQMKATSYIVKGGGRHHVMLAGKGRKFEPGMKVQIFGHTLTCKNSTDKTVRLDTEPDVVIDSRPIAKR